LACNELDEGAFMNKHHMNKHDRLVTIWESATSALQNVVRELKIDENELMIAGRYFNRLGQSGMFPSLLAVALSMASIDATRTKLSGTRPNLEGPFYKPNAPFRPDGTLFEHAPPPEARTLRLTGRVSDAVTNLPIADAELDIWHADHRGIYDHDGFNLRGIVRTDPAGEYIVKTVAPVDYSDHDHDPIGELFSAMERHNRRAAHLHVKVRARGYVPLTTQLFIPDTPYLDSDYVEGAVSDDLLLNIASNEKNKQTDVVGRFDFALPRLQDRS
jgi:protocatechuate 3,4-dioxygenase beta subunit